MERVAVIDIQARGAVQVLRLSSGRVNALDVELLGELTAAIRGQRQASAGPVVLTGGGRVFCAGVELARVLDGGTAYTDRLIPALSEAFEALFCYPGPTVAAINGAAIAGGCVLACACDQRLISSGAQIGASEIRVGVPFPAAALEILRYACGDRAEEVMLGGRLYRGAEAIAYGLAHRVIDGDVLEVAVRESADLATIPAEAYRHTKAQLRAPALARIRQAGDVDGTAADMWGADQTRQHIADHLQRLRRRDG